MSHPQDLTCRIDLCDNPTVRMGSGGQDYVCDESGSPLYLCDPNADYDYPRGDDLTEEEEEELDAA